MLISVIGTGYLGAVHAVCMAELGYQVIGFDTDEHKISTFNKGEAPFFEPQFGSLLGKNLASKKVEFTTDPSRIADADVHFICVGTPQAADGFHANTEYIDAALENIVKFAKAGSFVVGKSTVPVGTARRLREELQARRKSEVGLVWNPEFLREGFAVDDTLNPDRIVIGAEDENLVVRLKEVYRPIIDRGTPVLVTNLETAELVKVAANAFLATKISFINAMAEICEKVGGDVVSLADAIGHDSRIGRKFLNAGIGFGGGCLPKDIRAFQARANELGLDETLSFLKDIDAVNHRRRHRMVEMTQMFIGEDLKGKRVCVLGAAFKPNSDDIRDSPALAIAKMLSDKGAVISIFDPRALENVKKHFPTFEIAESAESAAKDAEIVLHLTEWQEFRDLDPAKLGAVMKSKIVVDGRNALDLGKWRAAGFVAMGMARAAHA